MAESTLLCFTFYINFLLFFFDSSVAADSSKVATSTQREQNFHFKFHLFARVLYPLQLQQTLNQIVLSFNPFAQRFILRIRTPRNVTGLFNEKQVGLVTVFAMERGGRNRCTIAARVSSSFIHREKPVFVAVVRQIASRINKRSLPWGDATQRCHATHQETFVKPKYHRGPWSDRTRTIFFSFFFLFFLNKKRLTI